MRSRCSGKAPRGALLIDCSTIDPNTAREVAGRAQNEGYRFADAPVSGGTVAAEAGRWPSWWAATRRTSRGGARRWSP
jgi:3-hydroxyisobutyrate dehydrogenase-like beta-hydroxyacid dehydrogenase